MPAAAEAAAPAPTNLKGKDDPAALKVAQRYVDAYTQKQARIACDLLAESVRKALDDADGCVKMVRKSFATGDNRQLDAQRSYVDGDIATVVFDGTERKVRLAREGSEWRVADGGT